MGAIGERGNIESRPCCSCFCCWRSALFFPTGDNPASCASSWPFMERCLKQKKKEYNKQKRGGRMSE